MPLSAAEVLTRGHLPTSGSSTTVAWGRPVTAQAGLPEKAPPSPKAVQAIAQTKSPPPIDSNELATNAASALLGLQNEPARLSHKQVEQHRRLKAKQYFDELRCLVPTGRDPKNDRNKVLQLAIEHLRNLKAGSAVPGESAANADSQVASEGLMFSMDAEESSSAKPGEPEADKRLSHNEVEQKRRLQARHHYEDLRSLLPNASKYDKNTVLFCTIQTIKQLSGVTDQSLAKMVSELTSESEQEADGAAGICTSGTSFAALLALKSPLGESPSDVTFVASTEWETAQQHKTKDSRKRTSGNMTSVLVNEEGSVAPEHHSGTEIKCAAQGKQHAAEADEAERKRLRMLTPGGASVSAVASTADTMLLAALHCDAVKLEKGAASNVPEDAFEAEVDGLDALTLLSQCAVQLQASQPSTPLQGPMKAREMSWGETSFISALPTMSLAGSAPGSLGKGSLVAAAAAAAAAKSVAGKS